MKTVEEHGITAFIGDRATIAMVDDKLVTSARFPDNTRGWIPLDELQPHELVRFRRAFGSEKELPTMVRDWLGRLGARAAAALR